ncbi:MAG TPA: hypothetical protein PLK30_20880 [Blastocatellia bacterium]|nr:hypothetical protein [Blastocatellia bacterium]
MSKGWKIGLSIAAGFMLVLMLGAGACVYYFSQLTGQIKEDQKAAERFGETADQAACLKETFARSKGKSSITAAASNSIFLSTCLQKSRPTPGFCDDVPSSDDKEKTKAWIKNKCQEVGEDNLTCGSVYGIVLGHCQGGTIKGDKIKIELPEALPAPSQPNEKEK